MRRSEGALSPPPLLLAVQPLHRGLWPSKSRAGTNEVKRQLVYLEFRDNANIVMIKQAHEGEVWRVSNGGGVGLRSGAVTTSRKSKNQDLPGGHRLELCSKSLCESEEDPLPCGLKSR